MPRPNGSTPAARSKARAALRIIEEAERTGELRPGKVLIDSSSGNTGIAYALIGAVKGYEVHLVMPANVSPERKALAHAYGAKLIESDPLEGSDGAIRQGARVGGRRARTATSMPTNTTTRPTGSPISRRPAPKSGGRRRA